jgi:hypothetical protein
VHLRRVNLHVDLARARGVGAQVAGDAVVKAHAEGEQEVGLLDGVVAVGLAVHAHHAQAQRVGGGQAAEAEEGQATGVCVLMANSRSSVMAPDLSTPCPARMTGRSACGDEGGGALQVGPGAWRGGW